MSGINLALILLLREKQQQTSLNMGWEGEKKKKKRPPGLPKMSCMIIITTPNKCEQQAGLPHNCRHRLYGGGTQRTDGSSIQMQSSPPTFLLTTNQPTLHDHHRSLAHAPRSIVPQPGPKNPFSSASKLEFAVLCSPVFEFWEAKRQWGDVEWREAGGGGIHNLWVRNLLHQLMSHRLTRNNFI